MVEITYQMVLSTLQTIALLVGITYYLIIMRNSQRNQELARKAQEHAVETRQAQLFHGIFSTLDEDWWNAYHFIIYHSEWTDWSDFSEKFYPFRETELGRATAKVLYVLEYLGVLVKEGLVSIRLVALLISNPTLRVWEKFEPIIQDHRRHISSQRAYTETEYLYNELVKYLKEHPELAP
jgi:hypothetical protein